jgi:hypothetical protein
MAASAASSVAATVAVSITPMASPAADRGEHIGMDVAEEHLPDDRSARYLPTGGDGLFDGGDFSPDQHQVLAGMHRPGNQLRDGTALDHCIAGPNPDRNRVEFEEPDRRVHDQTILSAPTTAIRRSRVNVIGRVMPSPVGLAIENEVKPSPPSPSPA